MCKKGIYSFVNNYVITILDKLKVDTALHLSFQFCYL